MTPTLRGRIETRIGTLLTVGLVWTLLLTPLLPVPGTPSEAHRVTLTSLALVAVVGAVLWEPLYHLIQQFRWEKDWPAMFVLLQAVPEALLLRPLLEALVGQVGTTAFLAHFVTTWLVVFGFLHGPVRVPFPRWRFRGGRYL